MVLIDIFCVAEAESMTLKLLEALKCELIDTKPILMEVFGVEENDAINVHYEASGYETSDFILNLGPVFFLILVAPIYAITVFLFSRYCCFDKIKLCT